jgi:hypothetical protein
MYAYFTYDLSIHSEILLPELVATDQPPDVSIRQGHITDTHMLPDVGGTCTTTSVDEALLTWPNEGSIAVQKGRDIIIESAPAVDERTIRLYLLGPALGVLLQQRGDLVLHASASAVHGVAVAFVGESGWGKSTTAAAMYRHGHNLIADDVVALKVAEKAAPTVCPAFPRLKISREAASILDYESCLLNAFHPEDYRCEIRISQGFQTAPLPLKTIIVLAEGDEEQVHRLSPQAGFMELVRHSYPMRFLGSVAATPLHFRQCVHVAQSVPIYRLTRPRSLAGLHHITRIVEDLVDK